jgi:hypothetical protein
MATTRAPTFDRPATIVITARPQLLQVRRSIYTTIALHVVLLLILLLVDQNSSSIHALSVVPVPSNIIMSSNSKSHSNSNHDKNERKRKQQQQRNKVVPIVACVSGIEVKRAASFYLRPGDTILEFGALLSHVSHHFLQTIGPNGHAVLVNIKHENPPKSGRNNNKGGDHRHQRNPIAFLGHTKEQQQQETKVKDDDDDDDDDDDSVKKRKRTQPEQKTNEKEEPESELSFVHQVDYVELEQFDDWRTLLYSSPCKNKKTAPAAAAAAAAAAAPIVAVTVAAAAGTDHVDGAAQPPRKQQKQQQQQQQQQPRQQHQQQQLFDAVFINVGAMIGNDLHLTALSMAMEFLKHSSHMSPPRVVIINSRSLSSLARRLLHGQQGSMGTIPPPISITRSCEPYLIATVGVQEYRHTIPLVVQHGDELLEVGCHSGITTALLHKHATATTATAPATTSAATVSAAAATGTGTAAVPRLEQQQPSNDTTINGSISTIATTTALSTTGTTAAGFCIGVDIGPRIIQSAKKQYPHIPFAVGDAWKTLQLLQLKHTLVPSSSSSSSSGLGYDAVYADIGGLSGADGLFESLSLLEALGYGLEPRCIVIKSLCMKRLASQLKSFTNVWEKIRGRPSRQNEGEKNCTNEIEKSVEKANILCERAAPLSDER